MRWALPVMLVAILAVAPVRDVPYRGSGIVDVAAAKGAAAVHGAPTKAGSVSGKPKPGGNVNGGKH